MNAAPERSRARPCGFTLVELLVVMLVVAGALLLVPPNLHMFGARSRLENAANTVVSLVAAAREQAIMDGAPVQIEIGVRRGEDGETLYGHRLVFTNIPVDRAATEAARERQQEEGPASRPAEREWLRTAWHDLAGGVVFTGVSERARVWQKLRPEQPYRLEFGPDGSVERAIAIRLESEDLEEEGVKPEYRTLTVRVNGLTAEAEVVEGLAEIPPQRDESEFAK